MIFKSPLPRVRIEGTLATEFRSALAQSSESAALLRDEQDYETICVIITAAEYASLKATHNLATSPDGPDKIAVTYNYDRLERIPMEEVLAYIDE
jgi:hypothetical protein